MREELKTAINEISPDNSGLYAAYISKSDHFCDAENVLLYNIGASAFRVLSKNGLCFERGSGLIPVSNPYNLSMMSHFYHYSQGSEFRLWEKDILLASWPEISIPTLTATSKPHLFWYALKKTEEVNYSCQKQGAPLKQFGLDIQLHIPEKAWCNLAILIKPLLDGVISAFHEQSAPCDNRMLQRLSALTNSSEEKIKQLLCEKIYPVLGARPIVSAFGKNGIIWNPEDDACVACRVTVRRNGKNKKWNMKGQLFSVISK